MQAFDGFRVLDLTHVLAGPFCTYQLGVLGAEVIKIEPPGEPDMARTMGSPDVFDSEDFSVLFVAQNANKKAITLDLKTTPGKAIFKKLVATADVIVENYRTGAMDALGLGYDRLRVVNPRIVYCSITGFGHTGAKRTHTAFDNVIQAFSGLMASTGTPETHPVRVGAPVLDYGTGAQAAFAIAAALTRRERTGEGQRLDIAMLDAAMMLMGAHVVQTIVDGKAPVPNGNSNSANHAYGCHETAEGLLMTGAQTTRQHVRFWRALGRIDIASEIENMGSQQIDSRVEHDGPIMRAILMTRPADQWEDLLNEAGVPAARVRTVDEALSSGQFEGRAVLQECGLSPVSGPPLKTPVAAFTTEEDGATLRSPPPRIGQHNHAVLTDLGFSPDEISGWEEQGVL